jgi:hypothetical protein
MRTAIVEGESLLRYPIRGIFVGCCALDTIATVSIAAATKIDDQPTFFIDHFVLEAITHKAVAETIIYGRRETRFVEGKRLISTQD